MRGTPSTILLTVASLETEERRAADIVLEMAHCEFIQRQVRMSGARTTVGDFMLVDEKNKTAPTLCAEAAEKLSIPARLQLVKRARTVEMQALWSMASGDQQYTLKFLNGTWIGCSGNVVVPFFNMFEKPVNGEQKVLSIPEDVPRDAREDDRYTCYGVMNSNSSVSMLFQAIQPGAAITPAGERADASLTILESMLDIDSEAHLSQLQLPRRPMQSLPFPWDGLLTSYVRELCTGVIVGQTWRESGGKERFFTNFVMARTSDKV